MKRPDQFSFRQQCRGSAREQHLQENIPLAGAKDSCGIDQGIFDAPYTIDGAGKHRIESADEDDEDHGELQVVEIDISLASFNSREGGKACNPEPCKDQRHPGKGRNWSENANEVLKNLFTIP